MREPSAPVIDVAAGIEMIHMATLLHDDIIDESPTRRHKPSAFKQYGLPPSLLAGDFLLVRAFGLCAKLDPYVIERTERACVELTEGEVLEGHLTVDARYSLEQYETVVAKKTASLFSLSAAVGAFYTGTSRENVQRLSDFGLHSGIAFQMVDDILDITAEEDLLGKPSGTDLRQQTPSLVNILWLRSGDERAKELFSAPTVTDSAARDAVALLRGSTVIAEAREVACSAANRACEALQGVTGCDEEVRSELLALLDYTLNRCF
jgi:geranylgeranyl pyrophosphate synthase